MADRVLRAVPLERLLLSGGDTSSLITQHLAPQALQVAARLAPGAPLCRVLSSLRLIGSRNSMHWRTARSTPCVQATA